MVSAAQWSQSRWQTAPPTHPCHCCLPSALPGYLTVLGKGSTMPTQELSGPNLPLGAHSTECPRGWWGIDWSPWKGDHEPPFSQEH